MLVRRSDGEWEEPPVQSYRSEAHLQQLVADSPHLVGEEEPVVALHELNLPGAGYLDVLVIGASGDLTLVEAKLNKNAEIRRAVVGQLLGYAGGLWGMTWERLDEAAARSTGKFLLDLAATAKSGGELDPSDFQAQVTANLKRGAFRLVFAVDEITTDLRRAVEFLNAKTVDDVETVVMELQYSEFHDTQILVPRIYGEEAAEQKRARRSPTWSEADFFAALDELGSTKEIELITDLLTWAKPRAARLYWGVGRRPSCIMVFDIDGDETRPLGIYFYPGSSGVTIAVNFEWMRRQPRQTLEGVLNLLAKTPTIAGLRQEIVAADFKKRPSVPAQEFLDLGQPLLTQTLAFLLDEEAHAPSPTPRPRERDHGQ